LPAKLAGWAGRVTAGWRAENFNPAHPFLGGLVGQPDSHGPF